MKNHVTYKSFIRKSLMKVTAGHHNSSILPYRNLIEYQQARRHLVLLSVLTKLLGKCLP